MTGWWLLLVGAALWTPARARYRLSPGGRRLSLPWRDRPTRRTPDHIVELLTGMRDELRAGAALRPAFERAVASAGEWVCPEALAVCRMGGEVPAALRSDARGDPMVLSLAALWQVCEGSGAAMADALDRSIHAARQTAKVRREVKGQLAGPRATMRVLALLPVIGIGMGLLMGANPIGFLIGSPWGWLCMALALTLEAAGVAWMRRIVRGIEQQI